MSKQQELNKDLLKYVFENENFPNDYKELKKIICVNDASKLKSFSKSYKLLENTNILISGKLNPELIDIYKINDITSFVSILINILYSYEKAKIQFNSYLIQNGIVESNYFDNKEYIEYLNYCRELPEHKDFLNCELVIKDLFDRFIYANIKEKQKEISVPNGKYFVTIDLPESRKTTTELAFREILHHILNEEPKSISEKRILEIVNIYYNPNEISVTKTNSEQKEWVAKSAIKNSIITAFKELGIITGENLYINSRYNSTHNREFKLIKFKSSEWKMNARTKQDTISSLIGGISNMNNVSDENKKLANFIIDFIG